jgi:hypothetical protein
MEHVEQTTLARQSKSKPEATPGIAVVLYILGAIAIASGVIVLVVTAAGETGSEADRDAGIGLAILFSSPMLFGFGFALRKLQQIEFHLRKTR